MPTELSDLPPEIIVVVLQHAVDNLPIRSLSSYALVNSTFRYASQRELLRTVSPINNVAIVRLVKVLKSNHHEWANRVESVRIVPSFRTGRLVQELLETARRITRVELDWEGFDSKVGRNE